MVNIVNEADGPQEEVKGHNDLSMAIQQEMQTYRLHSIVNYERGTDRLQLIDRILSDLLSSDRQRSTRSYESLIIALGPPEQRKQLLTAVFNSIGPVKDRHKPWTENFMRALLKVLLREEVNNPILNQRISAVVQEENSRGQVPLFSAQTQLTLESFILIYLTLIGLQVPSSSIYFEIADQKRAWSREVALRVLKSLAPNNHCAYVNLIPIERQVSKALLNQTSAVITRPNIFLPKMINLYAHLMNEQRFFESELLQTKKPSNHMPFETLMQTKREVKLQLLYKPESSEFEKHRHVMICSSGWLSQGTNKNGEWENLIVECEKQRIPLYTILWEAQNKSQLEEVGAQGLGNSIWMAAFGQVGIVGAITSAMSSVWQGGSRQFLIAHQNAKVAGKVLAHFLATSAKESHQFHGATISLVGFSLGSQVMKSTVNRLWKLNQHELVHNVYLNGSATYIRPQKLALQKKIFGETVSGQVYNTHAYHDEALVLFKEATGQEAIGSGPIYEKDPQNAAVRPALHLGIPAQPAQRPIFSLVNNDASKLVDFHMCYASKYQQIFRLIEFQS